MLAMVEGNSLNEIVLETGKKLLYDGLPIKSRNGLCRTIYDVDLYLTSPKNRHLFLHGRKNNFYASLAEVIWVFSNNAIISPYLTFFLPRAIDYSDDGISWRGAYGPRIYQADQMQNIIDMFAKDRDTRQACMTIWNPFFDTNSSLKKHFDLNDTKDRPCTTGLWFWLKDNHLYCKCQMRSNDLIWGLSNINVLEWTIFQECLSYILEAGLGYYHHSVVSLHVYDQTANQLEDIFKGAKNNKLIMTDHNPFINLGNIDTQESFKEFFSEVYRYLLKLIISTCDYNDKFIDEIFDKFNVSRSPYNQIFNYIKLVELYIYYKLNRVNEDLIEFKDNFYKNLPYDLIKCIELSSFTPKGMEI